MLPLVFIAAITIGGSAPAGSKWTRQYYTASRFSLELLRRFGVEPAQYISPGGRRSRVQSLRFAGFGYEGNVTTTASLTGALPKDVDFALRNLHIRTHGTIVGSSRRTGYVSASGVTGLETVIHWQNRTTWVRTYLSNSSSWEILLAADASPDPMAAASRILASFRIGIPHAPPPPLIQPIRMSRSRRTSAVKRKVAAPKPSVMSPQDMRAACRLNQLRIAEAEEQYRRFVKDDRFTTDIEELKRFLGTVPRCPGGRGYTVTIADGTEPTFRGSHAPSGAIVIRCGETEHKPFTPFFEDERPNSRFDLALSAFCRERRLEILTVAYDALKSGPGSEDWRSLQKLFPTSESMHVCPSGSFGYGVGRAPENLEKGRESSLPAGALFVDCSAPGHDDRVSTIEKPVMHSSEIRCRMNILMLADAQDQFERSHERTMIPASIRSIQKIVGTSLNCPDGGRYELSESSTFKSQALDSTCRKGSP